MFHRLNDNIFISLFATCFLFAVVYMIMVNIRTVRVCCNFVVVVFMGTKNCRIYIFPARCGCFQMPV